MFKFWILAAVCLVLLTGCSRRTEENAGDGTNPVIWTPENSSGYQSPTGYPDGAIQWEYVMINNRLYENNAESVTELPGGFDSYAATEEKLVYEMPAKNLQATHLSVGTVFYYSEADPSVVYMENQHGKYRIFVLCDDEVQERTKGQNDGKIRWAYVIVNDRLYENNAIYMDEVPEGFDSYAATEEKLVYEMPAKNLQATHLSVGTVFYYSEEDPSVIYMDQGERWERSRYVEFVLCDPKAEQ